MRFIIDTPCWLWWLAKPEALNGEARGLIADGRNTVYLSAASSLEIAMKYVLGKVMLPMPPPEYVSSRMTRDSFTPLPIDHIHALRVACLPPHHRDPFDRLLIAQAQVEGLPLMTADTQFTAYDVDLIRVW